MTKESGTSLTPLSPNQSQFMMDVSDPASASTVRKSTRNRIRKKKKSMVYPDPSTPIQGDANGDKVQAADGLAGLSDSFPIDSPSQLKRSYTEDSDFTPAKPKQKKQSQRGPKVNPDTATWGPPGPHGFYYVLNLYNRNRPHGESQDMPQ